jgi:hypothetical protein
MLNVFFSLVVFYNYLYFQFENIQAKNYTLNRDNYVDYEYYLIENKYNYVPYLYILSI